MGAVSPSGGDFSEVVTVLTKRYVRAFWALDRNLAYARHFPAINWHNSYSDYPNDISAWYTKNVSADFFEVQLLAMEILIEEKELLEIAKLIGTDVLANSQKLTLEMARVVRIGFLQQNAYHPYDFYVTMDKQKKMLQLILFLYEKCKLLLDMDIPVSIIKNTGIFEDVISVKYNAKDAADVDIYFNKVDSFYKKISSAYEEAATSCK